MPIDWGEELEDVWNVAWGPSLADNYEDVAAEAQDAHDTWFAAVDPLPPTPASPGYLGLRYNDLSGYSHKTRYRLLFGQSPLDYVTMLTEGDRIAPYLAAALPADFAVEGFFTQDNLGHSLLDSLLSASHIGTHNSSGVNMHSFSWSITGRTVAIDPDALPGNELSRIFPRHFPTPPLGAKGIPLSADVTLLNYAAALATSTICWGDYRGRKAGIRPVAPIQANAAVQRRRGW